MSVYNSDPYSWIEWSTGQTSPGSWSDLWATLNFTGKATGTYYYTAKRCISGGSQNVCSGHSPSAAATVLRTPGNPAFGSVSPNACAASLTVDWAPGSGGYPSSGATYYYDLQESVNGGGWTNRLLDTTSVVWSRSTADGATYQYRVRARYYWNGFTSGYSAWVSSTTLSMPECTDTSFIPQPVEKASDAIGSIAGSVSVLPSGAAGYTIPLQVPPGIGGVVPALSLDHNQGNHGYVGVGWALSGFSAISRCAAALEPDGMVDGVDFDNGDNGDRFCIGSQKLILVPGTGSYGAAGSEYRTEIDEFSRIIAVGSVSGGSSSFIVRAPTGEEMLYGSRNDSRIEAQGRSDVMTWALNTVTDSAGNKMEFYYNEYASNSEYVPNRIEYAFSGGVSGARVEFSYTTQSSPTMYLAGSAVRNTRLLQTITTYAAGAAVKEYQLEYETAPGTKRKRLRSLTECSRVSGTVCLEPTLFTWYGEQTPADVNDFGNLRAIDDVDWSGRALWPIDVDGDGKQELVYNKRDSDEYYYIKKTGTSTWTTQLWGARQHNVSESHHHWPMDVNGDGLTDLVYMQASSSNYHVIINHGNGSTSYDYWGSRSQAVAYDGKSWPMDVNGDGRMDLVYNKNGSTEPTESYYALIAEDNFVASEDYLGERENHAVGIGGTHWAMDVNSDGRSDLVYLQSGTRNYWAILNNGAATWTAEFLVTRDYATSYDNSHWLMDVNTDGLADLIYSRSGTSDYRVLLNKGNNALDDQYFASREESPGWNGLHWVVDVNADAVPDLVYNKDGTNSYYALTSQPDGTHERKFFGSKSFTVGWGGLHIEMDADGDGLTELAMNVHGTKQFKTLGIQSSFDLLKTVTDGLGNVTTFQYKSLNDSLVYSRAENPYNDYPTASTIIPLRVVYKVIVPDGVGGTRSSQYFYKKLMVNRTGRGMLGFAEVISTDNRAGIRSETLYNQAFPLRGLVSESRRCLDTGGACASDKLLQKTVNTYEDMKTVNGAGLADSFFVYTSQIEETRYSLDNALETTTALATVTTTNANPDAYGNIQSIIVETDSLFDSQFYKTTTANTFINDDDNDWRLGLLATSVVTQYLNGGTATDANSVRKVAFEYDPDTHLMIKETIEPDRAEPLKMVTAYERDAYGNTIKTTSCATDFANCGETGETGPSSLPFRITTTVYDALGQFPQSTINAEGESESYVYERKFGNKLSQTGPNGLTTTWLYDGFGKALKETRADGTITLNTYKWCDLDCPQYGSYYVITEHTGGVSATEYFDAQGRKLRALALGFDGRNIHTDTVYNHKGQVSQVSEPYFEGDTTIYWTQSAYDTIGRVTTVTPPTGPMVTTDYGDLSITTSRTVNGILRTDSETKNIIGQIVSVTNASGSVLLNSYDSQGALRSTETLGRPDTRISLTHDLRGRKTGMNDPDTGNRSYLYNGYGELVAQTDALNQTVTMKYDRLGRMTRRVEAEGESVWEYGNSASAHNIGKLVSVSGPDGLSTKTIEYDEFGRPIQVTTHIDIAPYTQQSYVTSQTYDGAGRIKMVLYPEAAGSRLQVVNRYNARGYLYKVGSPDGSLLYWWAQEVNARGQLEFAQLGNGASVQNSYRPETGWLDGTMVDAEDLIYHMGYEIDEVGNIESRTDYRQNLTEHFQYDILDRVTHSSITGGVASYTAKSYQYDVLGNLTYKTDVGFYTYGSCNSGPHAVCQAGAASYAYNANGGMTSGGGREVSYTTFNMPYQFEQGGNTLTFHYGPDRARVFKSDGSKYTAYIGMTDTGNPLYEHEVQGATHKHLHFIYAGDQALAVHTIQAGSNPHTKTEYLHRDHLNSVEAVSDASGAVAAYFSHDAWGRPRNADWTDAASTADAPGNLGFTGHEMIPEVGLVHMNGRVYDPQLGKFILADPLVQFPFNSQSYNRYSYALNNPLRYTDPTGYSIERLKKKYKAFHVRMMKRDGTWKTHEWLDKNVDPKHIDLISKALSKIPYCGPYVSMGFQANHILYLEESGSATDPSEFSIDYKMDGFSVGYNPTTERWSAGYSNRVYGVKFEEGEGLVDVSYKTGEGPEIGYDIQNDRWRAAYGEKPWSYTLTETQGATINYTFSSGTTTTYSHESGFSVSQKLKWKRDFFSNTFSIKGYDVSQTASLSADLTITLSEDGASYNLIGRAHSRGIYSFEKNGKRKTKDFEKVKIWKSKGAL